MRQGLQVGSTLLQTEQVLQVRAVIINRLQNRKQHILVKVGSLML